MEFHEKDVFIALNAQNLLEVGEQFEKKRTVEFLAYTVGFVSSQAYSRLTLDSEIIQEVERFKAEFSLGKYEVSSVLSEISRLYDDFIKEGIHTFTMDCAAGMALHMVDRLLVELFNIDSQEPRVASAFINSICPTDNPTVVDMIPIASELYDPAAWYEPVIMVRSRNKLIDTIVRLKCYLRGMLPVYDESKASSRINVSGGTFVFDSPATTAPGEQLESAPKRFERFVSMPKSVGRFIVITPNTKEHFSDIEKHVVPMIGGDLHLDAVVSLGTKKAKKAIKYQALVLSRGLPDVRGYTLYIDASGSNSALAELTFEERGYLAGAIFSLHQGHGHYHASIPSKVIQIMNAQFGFGYKDVKKLCAEVAHNHNRMVKIQYVKSVLSRKASTGESINFSADAREIVSRLQSFRSASCTYVIGNNGAGKSFMLRDIVYRMSESGVETIGVTTGLHDRFPSGDSSLKTFDYRGLRTRGDGVGASRMAQNITKLAAQIFRQQHMVNALSECLRVLGYEPRYYLMRRPETILSELPADVQFRMLSLTAVDNRIPKDLNNYEFGIVRSGEREQITPVSSLSSGEQNINYLLMSLIRLCVKGKVVLIDEPEISLHLQWQQALPKVFKVISRATGASFVVATHSPTLITNANDESDFCYELKNGLLRHLNAEERYSVESIILEGFGTYTPNNRGVHEKCARLVARSMAECDDVEIEDNAALKELDGLKDVLLQRVNRQTVPGADQDLDLIEKAYAAIELLLADRKQQSLGGDVSGNSHG
jgi:predicted ATPase